MPWKRGKTSTLCAETINNHRALANIMDCEDYHLSEAVVLGNSNLYKKGNIVYAPIYMVMFLEKELSAPIHYEVDLSVLA